MNLDTPLDDIIKRSRQSTLRGRGQSRARGRGRGRGRGDNFSRQTSSSFSRQPAFGAFLRARRSSASRIAKSFLSRRSEGLRQDLLEDAVGSALGVDTGTKLFISNLHYAVSNEDIKELFSEMGSLKHCGVHYDRSGRSLGTADVVFLRRPDAIAAMNRYNNVQLDGKPMKIDLIGSNVLPLPGRRNYNATPFVNGRMPISMRLRSLSFRRFQGRGRGRGRKLPTEVKKSLTAEDLDADLEKYHKDAMQIS